ncbi:MAG: MATE family efflux transporter [Lachnospiraceae bacterium]
MGDGRNTEQYQRMTQKKIPILIVSQAIPTIVSMLVSSMYNMVDTYFIAKLGTTASGAVGVVFSLMALIQSVGFMIGMGSGSLISRLLGERNSEEADTTASSGFFSALFLGILFAVLGLCFIEKIVYLLGATRTIAPLAIIYMRYILLGAPVMMAAFVLNNLLRAEGKAKLSMFGMAAGALLNVVLDPVFIFVFDWGMAGAAIATVLSQCVGMLLLLSFFLRKKSVLKVSFRNISRQVKVYGRIVKTGLPSLFRQGLASIATILLNHNAAVFGDEAVAAMSIVAKVFMVIFSILIGFGQGYQPVLGYNYGAGNVDRVKKAFVFTTLVGTVGMTISALLGFALAPTIMKWFIEDSVVIAIGITTFRAQCISMPFIATGVVANMTFQVIGKSGIGTFLSSLRQGIFFIPLIWILPRLFGLTGVQISQALADIATFFVTLPFLFYFYKSLSK